MSQPVALPVACGSIVCLVVMHCSLSIIVGQPYYPVVLQMPEYAASKSVCVELSSNRSYPSSICPTSSLHRVSDLSRRIILSYGIQVVTREVHRSCLRLVMFPTQDNFIVLTLLIMSMTCILSRNQMLVLSSLYVIWSMFDGGPSYRKCVMCLFSQLAACIR